LKKKTEVCRGCVDEGLGTEKGNYTKKPWERKWKGFGDPHPKKLKKAGKCVS